MSQDDNTQLWGMYAIIAFCITGVLSEILFYLIRGGFVWHFMDFVVILVLASIAGGGAFWACKKLNI